jgi:hypothetical protein
MLPELQVVGSTLVSMLMLGHKLVAVRFVGCDGHVAPSVQYATILFGS